LLLLLQFPATNLIPDLYTLKMKKVILITGASSGISKSIAQHLTGLGHIVYGTSGNVFLNEDENIGTLKMDTCVLESVQAGVTQIIKACGRIDIVIHHAGSDMNGPARLVNCVLPYMLKNNSGLIINLSPVAAASGLSYSEFYPAALEKITGSLTLEVSALGIEVCSVQPCRSATNINSTCMLPDDPQGVPKPNLPLLTPREKEIAGLICEGLTSKAISGKLFISEATVKTHTSNIYKKFAVVNKMELRNRLEFQEKLANSFYFS
jgi:NADP-dependent 3-hydroxy acid dehydrogenase YdfG